MSIMTDEGKLVLQIGTNKHFKILLQDGTEVKVFFLSKKGSTTNVLIVAPKEIGIVRFKGEIKYDDYSNIN